MKGKALALAFGVAALCFAAPASANKNIVAIALNPTTGVGSAYYGPVTLAVAEQSAVAECNAKHGPQCVYAGSAAGGCVAVAVGYIYRYEAATGPSVKAAEVEARNKLIADGPAATDGNPIVWGACSDGSSDGA